MSEGINRATLLGNLGEAPELRDTQGGQAVLNFRLATTTRYKSGDEWKENTQWHNCVVWGARAEALAKILEKGTRVLVEGEIRNSSYEDREGVKKYKSEINVSELHLLGGKPAGDRGRDDDRRPSRDRDDDRGSDRRDTRGRDDEARGRGHDRDRDDDRRPAARDDDRRPARDDDRKPAPRDDRREGRGRTSYEGA